MYNDNAVMQNYGLSACIGLMQEEEMNFLFSLDGAAQDQIRRSTIKAVLSLDIESHFNNLGVLKSKLAGDFPLPYQEATYEHRLLLLSFSLKVIIKLLSYKHH